MSLADSDVATLAKTIRDRGLTHVKVAVTDVDGVMRGKYVSSGEILGGLERGLGFCSCIIGWDCDDQLYTNNPDGLTGWHSGYQDIEIDAVAARDLPTEFGGKGLLLLAEMKGAAAELCPRTLLRRVVERGAEAGYEALVGFEYEFSLFAETSESARAKGFRDLAPISPGNFGYSVLRSLNFSELCEQILAEAAAMGVPLVGLHTENGPGIWEAAIAATDPVAAADRAILFKTMMKALARRHGLIATFMAKPRAEQQGHGGHIHLSLRGPGGGAPLFFDEAAGGSTEVLMRFVAGQLRLLPEFTALLAPTVNSYTRLTPGAWAPTSATLGEDNRTCALRLVGRTASSRRVEHRVPGADANPYLALAGALASGFDGIADKLPAPRVERGNAYELDVAQDRTIPGTLHDAAQLFRSSAAARRWFGDAFVDHFALSREWEEQRFRAAITSWELERYFEII